MRTFAGLMILACGILMSLPFATAAEKATKLQWKVPADKSVVFKLATENVGASGKAGLPFNLTDRSRMSYPLDSESEFVLNAAPENMIDVALVVKKFKFTPTNAEERNFAEQVRDSEERVQIRASMTAEGRNQSFYLDSWQKNQLTMFLQLPENPVRPGDRWRVQFSFITLPVEYNFLCEKSERVNEVKLSSLRKTPQGELVAIIDYNLQESLSGAMQTSEGKKQAVSSAVTFEGVGEFSVDKGRWNKFNGRFHYDSNLGMSGAADVNVDIVPVENDKKIELCKLCGEIRNSSKCCVVAPKKAAAPTGDVGPGGAKTPPPPTEKKPATTEKPAVAEEEEIGERVEFATEELVVKTGPKAVGEEEAAEEAKVPEEEETGEEKPAPETKPAVEKIEKVSLVPTPVAKNIEVSFPEGWEIVKVIPGKKVIVFAPMKKESRFREYVEVGVENLEGDMDLLKYSGKVIADFSQAQDVKYFHRGDTIIGGLAAKWFQCSYKSGESNVRALGYTMIKDGKGYAVICVAAAEQFEALKPLFEEIARSFSLVE